MNKLPCTKPRAPRIPNNGHHVIHVDGHGTVSYQVLDSFGDNTLVYMTRRQARAIAKRLLRAAEVKR